jgi:nanoRNase/pAp phosphatase (c-di-AMP/oligoRNAs hydrolase)
MLTTTIHGRKMHTTETRLKQLLRAVKGADQVLILPHNNPDPDAIACALGLGHLLEQKLHLAPRIAYSGIIGRAENRALVRYLNYPLQRLAAADLQAASHIVLVDTQPGAGNNPLRAGTTPAIVIDHHPWQEESADAAFVDVRPEIGSASTMMVEYLQAAGVVLAPPLATALFYGIKTDTLDLMRAATDADRMAFCHLLPLVDFEAVFKIDHAQLSPEYFKCVVETLRSAQVYKGTIVTSIGVMPYPDLTADMADLLLRMQECRWVVCMGVYKEKIVLSVRTRYKRGAGRLVRTVVGERGAAGGHGSMAGGEIPLNGADPETVMAELHSQFIDQLDGQTDPVGEPLV